MSAYRRILAAVDGSDASNRGLREALRLAKEERAQLFIMHIVDEYPAYAMPDAGAYGTVDIVSLLRKGGARTLAKAKAAAEKQGLRPKAILRETIGGSAAAAIVREAKRQRADLIVLGTHGRRGVRRLVLGSDAEHVVREAPVPVLLVRAGKR
jgi:nucleotide-binding universal stress UspA family protein